MTLYEIINKYENSSLNALYFENKTITYKELMINIRKMANYFKEKGMKKGDVVTLVLPNIPMTIYTFYALNALGIIQNIVHPLTTFDKIIETMKETNSKNVILLETHYQDNIKKINDLNYNFFFVNPLEDKSLFSKYIFYLKYKKVKETKHTFSLSKYKNSDEIIEFPLNNEKETSIYLHSGGTTGTPKVIELSDYALNNLVNKIDGIVKKDMKGKSMLAVLPTFHGFGLGMGIHAPLANGATSALMMKFNTKKVIEWINENKVNLIIGVPLLYQKLIKNEFFSKAKLENLDFCFIGGDNVPVSLINEFNNLMKKKNSDAMLLEGYGLTETVTVCNVNTKTDFKLGSVGKPLNGVEILILDDEMNPLAFNEIGEVYISGDTLMNGYLNDEDSTSKTLLTINDKIYVKTGDLGYLDQDGFLFLKGRKKRMFKISGLNVYPSEIEKIASDNEDVIDASLEFFDEPTATLVLFVIKNSQSIKSEDEIKEMIYNLLKNKVLKYSIPKDIIFMKEFPKTNVGKINHQGFINPYK